MKNSPKRPAAFVLALLIKKIKSNEAALVGFLSELGYTVFPLGINLHAVHGTDPILPQLQGTTGQ